MEPNRPSANPTGLRPAARWIQLTIWFTAALLTASVILGMFLY